MENTNSRNTLLHLVILATVCALVFMLFLGKSPFHDKAEPREALVVRDIVLEGRWLLPLRAGEQLPSKPPLFHWFAAMASILRGEMTESSIRFPSALFASLGVLLCYLFGRRLYDSETGLWAGLILATTALYYTSGIEARVDMTLAFFVAVSLMLFYTLYRGFLRHQAWWYLFFFIVGVGVTAKGPVSVILCGLVITTFLILQRRWDVLVGLLRHPGIVVGIVVCFAWYGVALYLGGNEFFGIQFVKENFARFFVRGEGGTGHQKPVYYFIPYLFTWGMPWTLFLPAVIWSYFHDEAFRKDELLFLGVWAVVIFVFFSLSAGKRPPYILPLYLPLALMTAVWLRRQAVVSVGKSYCKFVCVLACIIGLVFVVAFAAHSARLDLVALLESLGIRLEKDVAVELSALSAASQESGWIVPGVLLASAVLWFFIGRNFYQCNVASAVKQMVSVSVLTIVFMRGVILPSLAMTGSYKEFMQLAVEKVVSSQSLVLFPRGIDSSSIIFYGKDKISILPDDPVLLRERLRQSRDFFIVEEDMWDSETAGLASKIPIIGRSRGTGPDGDARLILVRGQGQ
ncbi:MAG: phospholipid carrier-dependent glycosyltransferase [Deltaproteobacteria bacterium]|nr:phospholipid carrier-dependent glycosyltransferase [Deltaproteobacteria bacterium]